MLRPYQEKAVEAIFTEWEAGNKKTLLVAATGTGKTQIFVSVAERVVEKGGRVLCLAHRSELLDQAIKRVQSMTTIPVSLEKASSSAEDTPIIVGSVQTLINDARLSSFPEDYFTAVIVDEAHHIMSDSYQKVLSHFPDAYVLGVTATPDRADEKALADYFDSKAFEYPLVKAILDGFLSPIKVRTVPLKLDIRNVCQQAGDFSSSELDSALTPYLSAIASEMDRYCHGRKTLVFTPLISTSQKFLPILEEKGFSVCEVNGKSKDREEKIEDIKEGKYDVVLNSMLLTEGFDAPSIDCIVNLRATKSKSLYMQCIGRGTRLSPETGKEDLLLLDFLWQTKRFDLLHPSSLVAQDENVAEFMNKESVGAETDIFALEEKAKEDVVREREGALAAMLNAMRCKKGKFIDPIQFAFSIGSEDMLSYQPVYHWELDPPTEKQIAALDKMGIDTKNIKTKGQACHVMTVLINRSKIGLSTPKQIKLLERYGFREVGKWSFDDASAMISRISDNHWVLPYAIHAGTYRPAQHKLT